MPRPPGGGAASCLLRTLTVNGCTNLSRLRVASPALEALDASGCRSCAEIELTSCQSQNLRSLRLDGCRELRRLSLPSVYEPWGHGGGGDDVGAGVAFLDPETTSSAGVADEVAALVAAATKARSQKKISNIV